MWAKIPAATASIACAACIAAASVAVPAMNSGSNDLKETIAAQVNLTALDLTPLFSLASLDGVPAYLNYLSTFNLEAFRQTDEQAGLDLLGALPLYEDLFSDDPAVRDAALENLDSVSALPSLLNGDISGLDAFSAVPDLLNGDITALDAFNAIPTYAKIADGTATAKPGGVV